MHDQFLKYLPDATDIHGVLQALLDQGRPLGLIRLRYYHYSPSEQKMVSVDSAGHDDVVASKLRAGQLVRFRRSRPLPDFDSFWSIDFLKPYVFRWDQHAPLPLQPRSVHCVNFITVPEDHCEKVLEGVKSRSWVDFPLIVGGGPVGKLSCDLESGIITSATKGTIDAFWSLALAAAPYLEILHDERLTHPLATIRNEIHTQSTLADLYWYCTEVLPQKSVFKCRYASILTTTTDSLRSTRLILRKTSYPPSQHKENLDYYDCEGDGSLTVWVARNGLSLRLHDLNSSSLLADQLRTYTPPPRWHNKIQDSEDHKTFLAIPIIFDRKTVLGVLRFTQKSEGNHFTEPEEQLLQRIASECIAPKLLTVGHSEFASRVFSKLKSINVLSVKESSAFTDLPEALRGIMEEFFPETPSAKKQYLVNLLHDDGQSFRHHAIGGSLRQTTSASDTLSLVGTLTAKAIESANPVLINDPERAAREQCLLRICPEARSLLACRISFGDRHYGALVVKSDRYDLYEETHGGLLALLAAQAGEILARRDTLAFSVAASGLRHDVGGVLQCIEHELFIARNSATGIASTWRDALSFSLAAIDAHCRSGRVQPHEFLMCEIRNEVECAAAAARLEVPVNCGLRNGVRDDLRVCIYAPCVTTIIYNLLKNAWEHGRGQEPVCVTADQEGDCLVVIVEDYGQGITSEAAEQILGWDLAEEFHRLHHDALVKRTLGVAICRKLARSYETAEGRRGSLNLERNSTGCRFVLRIPVIPQTGE